MTTPAAKKIKAKRARRPIYLMVTRLIDGRTGCDVGALIPANDIDARLLRERGFHMGKEIRAELKQSRNPAFHRLVHAIGNLLVDNVEEFRDLSGHDAIKQVQAKSGVCCDPEKFVIDLGSFGRHEVDRMVPRSIAFDEMEEGEFKQFFEGITSYIGDHYAGVMLDQVRAEFWLMVNGEGS
jgi:hypothetical protein